MESARCGIGNAARINDSQPAILSERFEERIFDMDKSLNSFISQRTHAKEFTAATDDFDMTPRP